jgi:hypothetical protein
MPSAAEYWHIGETMMRLPRVSDRSCSGEKRSDMGSISRGERANSTVG